MEIVNILTDLKDKTQILKNKVDNEFLSTKEKANNDADFLKLAMLIGNGQALENIIEVLVKEIEKYKNEEKQILN